MPGPVRLAVNSRWDADRARRAARALATSLDFASEDVERVVLAVSELATNLARYARGGEIVLSVAQGPRGRGLRMESRDDGPGIAELARALQDGFSTGGGLGGGLPGVQRLMDDFEIATAPGGTRIVACKWPTAR
jgi:anti-sigma regulatory factor (Ser/Thr protein kinase)